MKTRILQVLVIGLLSVVAIGTSACRDGQEKPKAECQAGEQKLDDQIPGGIAVCKEGKWAAPNDEFEIIDY